MATINFIVGVLAILPKAAKYATYIAQFAMIGFRVFMLGLTLRGVFAKSPGAAGQLLNDALKSAEEQIKSKIPGLNLELEVARSMTGEMTAARGAVSRSMGVLSLSAGGNMGVFAAHVKTVAPPDTGKLEELMG